MKKELFLILKTKYFNEIESGVKTSEYRQLTEYWLNRLTNHDFTHVTFQLGYSKNAKRITKEIIEVDIVTIEHEFFQGVPTDCFEIKFK